MKKEDHYIHIKKGREHNLKNVDLKIPHHKITCFTGVSGSGKSSLVYDIIGKESQRRYFETFSSYARQFMGKMSRPEVESIDGLMPVIMVDQKTISRNPRSTVGTISELYDYLRLLFARVGISEKYSNMKLTRSLFSFNSAEGWCENCKGLGLEDKIDSNLLIKDEEKSLRQGALKITTPSGYTIYSQVTIDVMNEVCKSEGFTVDIPWKNLSLDQKNIVLNGSSKIKIPFGKHTLESRMKWSGITAKPREEGYYKGILPIMENILRVDRNPNILRFAQTVSCNKCKGTRLNQKALSVHINGLNIIDFAEMSIAELKEAFTKTIFNRNQKDIGNPVREKIINRCEILENLGLGYLSLMRSSESLSGGEAQRIRLATQTTNGLRGILYILDEPSIGLHPYDNNRMIQVMQHLRNQGNTVLVVEHDKETMLNADQIIDIGPLAGKNGGEVLFNTTVNGITEINNDKSKTLKLLRAGNAVVCNKKIVDNKYIRIRKATLHNLRGIHVDFKQHALNVVTGVSGAGKSTLVFDLLGKYFETTLAGNKEADSITSDDKIYKIIEINQLPIGRTPRSNAATYTKLFDLIRKLFASLPESKKRNWKQSYFSFNTKGGRCETCEGAGYIETGMHFLNNVATLCSACGGKRYKPEILEIEYKGKNISEVLEMEITDALDFFIDNDKIHHYLKVLNDLGLGYLSLGQPATTLSGGEAQRLKLATELVKPNKNHTLYIFDEPTTGLHHYDIKILLKALQGLTEKGHTVIVIEHDKDIITQADWIVDLGPLGGDRGGDLVYSGNYEGLLSCEQSYTAKALRGDLKSTRKSIPDNIEQLIEAPISLKGVNTHNLKNIDIDIPRNKLSVITGVSGSGKSSLAFDSLFAEGQYRFTESFSTYTRSLINQKTRPDIAETYGLTPTIAIDSKSIAKNPRATVGTICGVYDLLRLLYARVSIDHNNNLCTESSSVFSFNHEKGACLKCNGLGFELTCDTDKLISNPELALNNGAMKASKPGLFYGDPYGQHMAILNVVGPDNNIDYNKPWCELSKKAQDIALFGTGDKKYRVEWKFKRKNREGTHEFETLWLGLSEYVNAEYKKKHNKQGGANLLALMKEVECNTCNGNRLNNEALQYTISGKNIAQITNLEIDQTLNFITDLEKTLTNTQLQISAEIRRLIKEKLYKICQIGLSYLSLSRSSISLSGGEGRRLRLISQLGGELTGITYVLDEPTIGLHSKDTQSLISLLKDLAEQNTVVVVEHDKDIIESADYLIELGTGAGINGGKIVEKGSITDFMKSKNSITTPYFKNNIYKSNKSDIDLEFKLTIKKAKANNLKDIDLNLPINGITVFAGVSGSGKTSLLFDVIGKSVRSNKAVGCDSIEGLQNFDSVIYIDQSAVGKNPLSTPASYLGVLDDIRNIFSKTEKAKQAKLKASHFSYNSKLGQCDTCKGQGQLKVSMDFLTDVYIPCSACEGQRFKQDILSVKWENYSIYEILNKTIAEAKIIFKSEKKLFNAFELLQQVGLGHLKLGQGANTLSGGEAQRLKLVKELLKETRGRCLYLFDEPTTGLHFADIENLLKVFFDLRDKGHALYIVEHHPWFYTLADYLITLGPKGGNKGGYIIE